MKILVTNDDGIDAPGLWAITRELQKVGEVRVVAPSREQSGVGASISLRLPIKAKKVESHSKEVEAYSIEGTPADCVIVGLRALFPREIDLVISGINKGPNIGYDIFVSGTVGAALQGFLRGIPSLAISLDAYEGLNFEPLAKVAYLLATNIRNEVLPKEILLNVNSPNLTIDKIAGIEITELSSQSYCDKVEKDQSSEGYYRIKRNEDSYNVNQGSDIWALQQSKISITTLFDNANGRSLQLRLQNLAPIIFSELSSVSKS